MGLRFFSIYFTMNEATYIVCYTEDFTVVKSRFHCACQPHRGQFRLNFRSCFVFNLNEINTLEGHCSKWRIVTDKSSGIDSSERSWFAL